MEKNVFIRKFHPKDREVLRQICCDVADRGEPIENFFPDREFAADFLTNYYLDYEPESTFVAELDNQVIGYINGCVDNRRYGLVILFLIIPRMIFKSFWRGVFLEKEFGQIIGAMLRNWRRIFIWRKKSFHSHQGHVHIGVAKAFRQQHVGEKLIQAFLIYAQQQQVDEMTASVHDGNIAACRFFERLGFKAQERYPMTIAYGQTFKEYHAIYYVKTMA